MFRTSRTCCVPRVGITLVPACVPQALMAQSCDVVYQEHCLWHRLSHCAVDGVWTVSPD